MEGWGWQSVHDPELLPKVLEQWKASIATAEPFEMEFPLRGADGKFRWFLTRIEPLRDGGGGVVRWFGTNTDVTALREAREVLTRSKEDLKRLVAERTTELEAYRKHLEEMVKQRTGELNRTMEELKRSNRELEHFAYAASHDLQEPLRAVGGYVQLLRLRLPDKLDDKAQHYIEGAADGASRMAQQILDLLELSRVGTRGLRLARTNLGAPLETALRNLYFASREADARVTADPLPTLLVDEGQMVLLFQNLIGNALKFRSESPPEIHVGARREQGRWVMWVRDNGIGIDSQYFERIFQVFQRLHTREKYPGSGVGLSLCRRVVERHEGQMWVESQAGQGAVFYFSLPGSVEGNGGAGIDSDQ